MKTISTKKLFLTCLNVTFLILFFNNLVAQSFVTQTLNEKIQQKQIQSVDLLTTVDKNAIASKLQSNIPHDLIENSEFYSLNSEAVSSIRKNNKEVISVFVILPEYGPVNLNLYGQTIFTNDLTALSSEGEDLTSYINKTLFYRGNVEGEDNSLVSLTIFNDQVAGVISIGQDNFNLGKIKNQKDHILFMEKDLDLMNEFICGAPEPDSDVVLPMEDFDPNKTVQCVRLRVEVDNQLASSLGGNSGAMNYVAGLFNEVLTIYGNDNISMVVSEIFVWENSSPYSGGASAILNQMSNTSPNADLTSLLSSQSGGGIAWVGGLCSNNFGTNFNSVNGFYSSVPTYSWDVNVVAHELGHNLSSPHTHACAWNGNNTAIDGCGANAGYSEGCSGSNPSGGGTLMSYCHLTNVGVNFNLGFGPQPSQRMRSYIDASFCLGTSCGAEATCDDGIQNGSETDIDCGGVDCTACPTCNDGILNGTETEVDCGGQDCSACPTCDDGILNGTETEIDCGGNECLPCDGLDNFVVLNLKAYLEGPFELESGLMTDWLRSEGSIPLQEPYSAMGYNLPSTSTNMITLGITGPNAIVDWVLVELRGGSTPGVTVASQAALLQRDGDIVSIDGVSPLEFNVGQETKIFVALRHRNHFGIRTFSRFPIEDSPIAVDFTSPSTNIYGLNPVHVADGQNVMIAGDANADGQINTIDKNVFWRIQNGAVFNYSIIKADFNLDGVVNSIDKNIFWRVNNSEIQQLD